MSVTARQIITKSMQKIGLLTKTEQPSSDEVNDGLYALNAMLSTWSNEAALITVRTEETFPLTAGVNTYSIGPGQTFNTTRPTFINDSHVRLVNIDYVVTVIPDEQYHDIQEKTLPGTPYWLNYNNGFPTGSIRLYPTPDTGYSLFLLSEKPIASLTLDAVVSLPPGWEEAIIYNLAVRMAPEYGQPVSADVIGLAKSTLSAIKTAILRNRTMDCTPLPGIPTFTNGYYFIAG